MRVGLKGAMRWRKAGDASTEANAVSQERSKPPDSSASGLSGCFQPNHTTLNSTLVAADSSVGDRQSYIRRYPEWVAMTQRDDTDRREGVP